MGRRARGSWAARLTGIGVIIVVVAGAVTAYLVTTHQFGARPAALPTRVVNYQTVGLIGEDAQSPSASELVQLLGMRGAPRFTPVSAAEQQSGSGQWTADLMVGNSYIFIFLPSDDCLSATGSARHVKVVLQHCDLKASQRWRRIGPGTLAQGHAFYAYANMANGACLTEGAELPGQALAVGLSACAKDPPADQDLAFWWAAG